MAVLRRMTLGAGLLVLIQAGLGIVVNLYVTVPPRITQVPGRRNTSVAPSAA